MGKPLVEATMNYIYQYVCSTPCETDTDMVGSIFIYCTAMSWSYWIYILHWWLQQRIHDI